MGLYVLRFGVDVLAVKRVDFAVAHYHSISKSLCKGAHVRQSKLCLYSPIFESSTYLYSFIELN